MSLAAARSCTASSRPTTICRCTLELPRSAPVEAQDEPPTITLHAEARAIETAGWDGQLYRTDSPPSRRSWPLVAVPYATWDNRTPGQMRVWLREANDHGQ